MELQGRDLKLNLSGDDVTLLHRALLQLNTAIPARELAGGSFGAGTRKAIARLQKLHGLPVTGIVDQQTARTLGALSAMLAPEPAPRANAEDSRTVSGRVYDSERAAVGALAFRVVDRNARRDTELCVGVTGGDGRFTAHYEVAAVRKAGKDAPDLQVQVLIDDTVAGVSAVAYGAADGIVLDVLLDAGKSDRLPSEYEALTAAIGNFHQEPLGDLEESPARLDISYLANKTGWDARAVALAALGDKFARQTDIPAMYFYALFRAGVPASEDALFRADADTLATVWKSAVGQGLLPAAAAKAIPKMIDRFQALGARQMLVTPVVPGTSSYAQILSDSGLKEEQQHQFSQLYMAHSTDMPAFWTSVEKTFGADAAGALRLTGKLAFLTLNNAPLMQAVGKAAGGRLSDPAQLVAAGFYDAERWSRLLTDAVPLPQAIPGATPEAQRRNYADYLSAQLRLSYPTATMAQLVKRGTFRLPSWEAVGGFLDEHQQKFLFGAQAIEQYAARHQIKLDAQLVADVKRLHRVHQITASDSAMSTLLDADLDSAWRIVQQDRTAFTHDYAGKLGGADAAAQVYDKAVQVHGAVLNLTLGYLTARNAIPLGSAPLAASAASVATAQGDGGGALLLGPTAAPEHAGDVMAYATLESLYGSMDFCHCDECRSILSPAAYLVDLLLFTDKAADGLDKAQTVLLQRRPDIQYLPLTCENTNTPMPYIDVVNEILEYYIANSAGPLSLQGYQGYDTGATATEDLMASPQYVLDAAYVLLQGASFPPPLPFQRSLETLRLYAGQFAIPLGTLMERMRAGDDLERGARPYGWRDILMEQLGLSREEYRLLTDGTLTLQQLYGYAAAMADADVIAALSNGKAYARRLGISYEDLAAVLKARFVNPHSNLVPRLQRLGVNFGALKALKDGTLAEADFLAMLPTGAGAPDAGQYGGDIVAWIRNADNHARIMAIITLVDPVDTAAVGCSFDRLELRYALPMASPADTSTRLGAADYIRILRFVRLWRKLGWTIEQTDDAICALLRADGTPPQQADIATVAALDAGFLRLLPRLGIVARTLAQLNLDAKRDLGALLACWADLATHGQNALYRQMFLNPSVRDRDRAFADNGYGAFLDDSGATVMAHGEALRAAFNLSGEEFERICAALGYGAGTPLTLAHISAMFRRGWLARKLKLSVRELLLLTTLSGLDPYAPPDMAATAPALPAISRLIALVAAMKERSFKSAAALYLIWNQDLSGKSAPDPAQLADFARGLRAQFADIDQQFAAADDPAGDLLRARMTLVYGEQAADAFFALLDDSAVYDTPYSHATAELDPGVTAADVNLAYDHYSHRLAHTGLLDAAGGAALKAVAGVSAAFAMAVDALVAQGLDRAGAYFARFPELKPLYDGYVASPAPAAHKRSALLAAFQPELARRRKRELALQRLSAAAVCDLATTGTLLEPAAQPYALHAHGRADQPLLNDIVGIDATGLLAQFHFRDTATGAIDATVPGAGPLDYAPAGAQPLPANPAAGAAISARWQGMIETPEAGYYNLIVEADAQAQVTLAFDGSLEPLIRHGATWRNQNPMALAAGKLYSVSLTVERVSERVRLSWETPQRPRQAIPARYLYAPAPLALCGQAFTRFLKAAALLSALGLSAAELAYLGNDSAYRIDGDGWLNALAVDGDPSPASAAALLKPLVALLDYARIKAALQAGDGRLLAVLRAPAAATAQADSLLFTLTRWEPASLADVLVQVGADVAALGHFETFRRVYDACATVQALGLPAARLIAATSNAPAASALHDFESALRARYDAGNWREVVKPVNDALRVRQRDALVAYVLQQMKSDPASAHIDTADKLFEYFLVDVQMECCMQTSRIRHALSSIQLFVERCLMNLEPRVSPAAINADHWKWMKRFRVWQANRKVFLFPENWLEPELRDDKSPLYQDMESTLLQQDITDDAAASAMLTYLAGLADIAKLEPCGMFVEEQEAGADDDIVHVVARSAGARRGYHYRRYELGYWTPWQPIKLEIEDDPVVPVVWNHRLLLVWVKILIETPLTQGSAAATGTDPDLATMKMSQLRDDAKAAADSRARVNARAMLYWSEFYNGRWQSPMTSDLNDPVDLGWFAPQGQGAFNRADLRLGTDEVEGQLRVTVYAPTTAKSFLLYNTHSLPQQGVGTPPHPPTQGKWRWFEPGHGKLTVKHSKAGGSLPATELSRAVVSANTDMRLVQPNHPVGDSWNAPFFYGDRRYVFYVTSQEQPIWVVDHVDVGVVIDSGKYKLPPLVIDKPRTFYPPKFWEDGGPITINPGVVDPAPIEQLIDRGAVIRQGLPNTLPVSYGGVTLGPLGAIKTRNL